MRRKWMASSAVVVLIAAIAWIWVGPYAFVRFPTDFDETMHYSGVISQPVAPGDSIEGRQLLSVTRHVWATKSTFNTVTLRETIVSRFGDQTLRQTNGYVLDRRTMKTVPSLGNFAFSEANPVNRKGAYGPSLPTHLNDHGKYTLWSDDTGTPYNAIGSGVTGKQGGLSLVSLTAGSPARPVTDEYREFLDLPAATTLTELAHIGGVDLAGVLKLLSGALPAAAMQQVVAATTAPVPLNYELASSGAVEVEPLTGGIVNVSGVLNRLMVSPNLDALGLRSMLADYALDPTVRTVLDGVDALGQQPALPAMSMQYSQTPQSIEDAANTASQLRNLIRLVEVHSRVGLFALAALLLAGAAIPVHRRTTATPAATRTTATHARRAA